MKKTKKICDELLERFGDGEYLSHICTGKGEYPDQATFWRWRQKDRELAEQFMSSLVKNVSALLEKSELLIENASTRDEIPKADNMLSHYRWKAEKLVPSMQSTSKSLVELQGAILSAGWKMPWLSLNTKSRPKIRHAKQQGSREKTS